MLLYTSVIFHFLNILTNPLTKYPIWIFQEQTQDAPREAFRLKDEPTSLTNRLNDRDSLDPAASTSTNTIPGSHSQPNKGKESSDKVLTRVVLLPVMRSSKYPQEPDDRFDAFGKTVATKLRDLPNQQRIICEKIINDALDKAKLGELTPNHELCELELELCDSCHQSDSQNTDDSEESEEWCCIILEPKY